jgi:hypothetical protein
LKHLRGKTIREDKTIGDNHEKVMLGPVLNPQNKISDYEIKDGSKLICDLASEELWVKIKL